MIPHDFLYERPISRYTPQPQNLLHAQGAVVDPDVVDLAREKACKLAARSDRHVRIVRGAAGGGIRRTAGQDTVNV